MSNFNDVKTFHKKFGLLNGDAPRRPIDRKLQERMEFLFEEFREFAMGCGCILTVDGNPLDYPDDPSTKVKFYKIDDQDLAEQADALIDLVYVAMGTAVMLGLPWQELWDDVQRANMDKERGVGKRGHPVDCIKPEGWVGPKTQEILLTSGYDESAEEVDDEIK